MFWKKRAKHKLVVFGDSLAQGFSNGGIYRTDINFPSFLVRSFKPEPEFRQPVFTAQAGIPLNLEVLIRGLSEEFGDKIDWVDFLPASTYMYQTLRRIKKYWEGGFKDLSVNVHEPFHNQSVWGFSICDAWLINDKNCSEFILANKDQIDLFNTLPEHAMYTTARMVLNPSFSESFRENSQLSNVEILQKNGGIENLIVCLGHNNIIGAITDLKLIWSELDELESFPANRNYTICRPEHFEILYRKLAERISKIGAERVFVPTIPHMTIPPVTRGVNSFISANHFGYFDYYTHFWVWDDEFSPAKHPHLTKDQAILIDLTVDEYNSIIHKVASEYGWWVVPVARNVAAMARRRYEGEFHRAYPEEFIKALQRNPATSHLVNNSGKVNLGTDYIRIDKLTGKLNKGGIFSLDGLHPTTIGYGLMAYAYFETMKKAGVRFQKPLDWDYIISQDTLITNPPKLLSELQNVLRFLQLNSQEKLLDIGSNVLSQVVEKFSNEDT